MFHVSFESDFEKGICVSWDIRFSDNSPLYNSCKSYRNTSYSMANDFGIFGNTAQRVVCMHISSNVTDTIACIRFRPISWPRSGLSLLGTRIFL